MNKMNKVLLSVLLLLISARSFAIDYYVAPTGNDSNGGTASAPFKTIKRASLSAKPGTTVHVAQGTYYENIKSEPSGTATARIKYISDVKWGAKVIGSGIDITWWNNGNYVDIIGFDISGSGRIGILNNASFGLIANNHVHDMKVSGGCNGGGGAGILNGNYKATDNDIIGNVVHDIGVPGACNQVQGIYHSNLRGRIYNNIVYRASSFGIHLWHAANKVVIMNNTVFENGSSTMGGGIVVGSGDSPGGIVVVDTRVANNIVFNNPGVGISQYCYSGVACIGSNNTVENNLVIGSRSPITMRVGTHTGTIVADPKFVNLEKRDVRLTSGSQAIDRGDSELGLAKDIIENPRTGVWDIGAYEFTDQVSVPIPEPTPVPTPTPIPLPEPIPEAKAAVSLSTTTLNFGGQKIGTRSVIKIVTIKNVGNAAMKIASGFVINGDFAFGGLGTCRVNVSYAPGQSCTASLVFIPTARGSRIGSISMLTNASSTPSVVKLTGWGRRR